MEIEVNATPRAAQGNGCEPPPASRRARAGHRLRRRQAGAEHRARSQGRCASTCKHGSVPRLDPDAEPGGREAAGAAARRPDASVPRRRCCTSTSSASRKDKKIHMKVPLHFVNAEIAPGVKSGGGIVSHVLNELDVTLPAGRPARVHRGRPGQSGARPLDPPVRDLKLPKGVEVDAAARRRDAVVATIAVPRAEVEPRSRSRCRRGGRCAAAAAPAHRAGAEPGSSAKKDEKKERQGEEEKSDKK